MFFEISRARPEPWTPESSKFRLVGVRRSRVHGEQIFLYKVHKAHAVLPPLPKRCDNSQQVKTYGTHGNGQRGGRLRAPVAFIDGDLRSPHRPVAQASAPAGSGSVPLPGPCSTY